METETLNNTTTIGFTMVWFRIDLYKSNKNGRLFLLV